MSTADELVLVDGAGYPMANRCAAWARDVDLDPAGTAPTADVFLLVEHPLPWPKDVDADPGLAAVVEAAREAAGDRKVRLQAVAVEPGAPPRRVIAFSATRAPFVGFGRLEGAAPVDGLADLARSLVAADPPPPAAGVTDVLVCTHGSRDSCCGSLGTRLWRDAAHADVRVWRTSHTGGHRFAPTAVTFPDGNYWAFLDADALAGIVDRSSDPRVAAGHLRGCAAFPPAVQVADRVGLETRGWDWLASGRFADERSAARIELCFEAPDGTRGGFDVCLGDGRLMPVPECGKDPATAPKAQVERKVISTRSWV